MASIDKVVDKIKRQPNGIKMGEADRVLPARPAGGRHYDYVLNRQVGSHRHYLHSSGDIITIPDRKPTIKPIYVKEIIARLGL
ncbi:MAG: type II toxin-antitoxin system HicA family toxin [Defluviitaleaceae bacterium]|nr:type II toxin-antitoxin system HicA family toxin [Defluviitaleaceae bacterium]